MGRKVVPEKDIVAGLDLRIPRWSATWPPNLGGLVERSKHLDDLRPGSASPCFLNPPPGLPRHRLGRPGSRKCRRISGGLRRLGSYHLDDSIPLPPPISIFRPLLRLPGRPPSGSPGEPFADLTDTLTALINLPAEGGETPAPRRRRGALRIPLWSATQPPAPKPPPEPFPSLADPPKPHRVRLMV